MRKRLPEWLKKNILNTGESKKVRKILSNTRLNTVCDSARCPNKGECYSKNTATFMILGKSCTRSCRFCSIDSTFPEEVNHEEPKLVADAVKELNLEYAVITSVTRDDLPDEGAGHFAKTIKEIRELNPGTGIEVLTPDFNGKHELVDIVLSASPDVFNHNIETVKRLYPKVRPQADYYRSLEFISYIKESSPEIYTKSGLMVGLGETFDEIIELLTDLRNYGCDIVTVGQYIQPTKQHLSVEKYYTPEEFNLIEKEAIKAGIKNPVSAPLVRSSYQAKEVLNCINK